MSGPCRTYDDYGRYCGYPEWIITFGGHELIKWSRKDVDAFIERVEATYARIGKKPVYSIKKVWVNRW